MAESKTINGIKVLVCADASEVAKEGARVFAQALRDNPTIVLGLATGGTPVGMYKELIKMHGEGNLDFSQAVSFNLDEYVGLDGSHPQSYRYFMNDNLFNHVNIELDKTHVPSGKASDIDAACRQYEQAIKAAGGIDMQLLGIGSNGHIAFNEPGSAGDSRTHKVDLTERTIKDNARFFESMNDVPRQAVTMGIGTILEAKKIVLLATGANKADAVNKALKGPMSEDVPASFLQRHRDTLFIVDAEAGAKI